MQFFYNERKAAQMAAQFAKRAGGKINYLLLIKLMYLADRRHFLDRGCPITGDTFYSLKLGPVLSDTLNLITEVPRSTDSPWFEYITPPSKYEVSLVNPEPSRDELSNNAIRAIEDTFEKYGAFDPFELADLTHTILPEWKDPGASRIRIQPEDILREEGFSEAEISGIRDENSVGRTLNWVKSLPVSQES